MRLTSRSPLSIGLLFLVLLTLLVVYPQTSKAAASRDLTFTRLITVTTTADNAPPCAASAYSLRCAIIQANSDGSGDKISFHIPSKDPGCKATIIQEEDVYVCTIAPASDLPYLGASNTLINGYTQPEAEPNDQPLGKGDDAILTIRLDGSNVTGSFTLYGNASGNAITGLEFTHYGMLLYPETVTNNRIFGNFIGTDGTHALGGVIHHARTGISLEAGASNNLIGGETPDKANLISDNGNGVSIGAGNQNIVEGNYIGTDASGSTSGNGLPNSVGVVVFANGNGNLIGGLTKASANIIAHNNGVGGVVINASSNTNVIGNTISSNFVGIQIADGATGLNISRNVVTRSTSTGIRVGSLSTDNVHAAMQNNRIFANGGLGIDLYPIDTVNCSGPTPGGPNDYTPCPVIASATTAQVSGIACANCVVEVYVASNEADDQGHGEGKTLLNSVTADSNGNWSVNVALSSGRQVTATATTPSSPGPKETSEFAQNVAVS